ncbi:MAG: phenylalanine--tRNA ligase subunit alpha [Myxococcales bacterium]|nr:phenylalanine--tRNA ligase subunit alpha [Myxococcales bacterium]
MADLVLTEEAARVWRALAEGGEADVARLVEGTGLDQSQVMVAGQAGAAAGFIEIEEQAREEVDPAPEAAALLDAGLAERRAATALDAAGGEVAMPEFVALAQREGFAVNEVFKHGAARGWIERRKGAGGPPVVALTDAGRAALGGEADDERAVRHAIAGRRFFDEMPDVDAGAARALLQNRKELARLRSRTRRVLRLTDAGRAAWAAGPRIVRERNALTQEELRSGAWRDIVLRPYDVTLPAARIYPAKAHPVRKIIEQTRRAFLELGFEEVGSPAVEVAFWNFDALFQPQDHPARDMQDTFYMADPARGELPREEWVSSVGAAHRDGGDTGSRGWGYKWESERARAMVLRTHCTAATIRALARHPAPPYKAFCVGWTHRNETLSYKHLPVFHQVDGIVIDKDASLATLLGTLKAFYQKMGFSDVRFKPAFYPYTEPSVDVMVYMPERGKWLEMGGSGIFRPEVTEPLGCKDPVLAWGLGIERLAMLRLGFSDIRDLYQGGLDTVEGVPACR